MMKKLVLVAVVLSLTAISFAQDDDKKESKAASRVQAAADVLNEIQGAPDQGIPEEVLGSAECIAVVPTMLNGGFIVGAAMGVEWPAAVLPRAGVRRHSSAQKEAASASRLGCKPSTWLCSS